VVVAAGIVLAWCIYYTVTMMRALSSTGSGGIGAVSIGISEAVVETIILMILPLTLVWQFTKASGPTRLAVIWRRIYVGVMFAIPVLSALSLAYQVAGLALSSFLAIQVFFVVGAVAIWIASRLKRG
jgi:hypothetical protein